MFLFNFFKKPDTLLKAEIRISNDSIVDLLEKSKSIGDREMILMGLLVYSRVLRYEKNDYERNLMLDVFPDFNYNFNEVEDKEHFKKLIINFFETGSSFNNYRHVKKEFKAKIELKKKDNGVIYLYMGNILFSPLSSVVYSIFNFIWNNIEEKNQIKLLQGFTTLSIMYKNKKFSIQDAIEVPNMIVYEIIPFE